MKSHYQIVVIGAGTGGIMAASRFLKQDKSLEIIIIDPSDTHWYQPAWTLVGAGTYNYEETKRPMKDLIPQGATWLKDSVTAFLPDENKVITQNNGEIGYDYLVVSPGLVYDFSLIEGLEDALKKDVVCSNYVDPNQTWRQLQKFSGGNAVFTQPTTPIKCGGAPQKIMYLASDLFRKKKIKANVSFYTPGTVIFGVKVIADTLWKVVNRYNIKVNLFHAPYKIDADKKIAYFKDITPQDQKSSQSGNDSIEVPFDFFHLAPPQTAPGFVKNSTLANAGGWLDVDDNSLQHKKYPNIFGLGDVTSVPTAKTGAAIRKQTPVVVDNITRMMNHQEASNKSYNGYSSCPLVTGYGKMVLAEFNYKNEFLPDPKMKRMLISDSSKEHWRLWILKKYILPYLYWNKMMKGEDV